MQIISWNVNSIKKRLSDVLELLQQKSPDLLLLQELKCVDESFPFFAIESLGYNVKLKGEKTYNGVACISRHSIELVADKLIEGDNQARYLECFIIVDKKALRVINVYVPNGASLDSESFRYKGKFFDALFDKIKQCLSFDEPLIVAGDYNVALGNIDVYSPQMLVDSVCFHISMRRKMRALLGLGMQDVFRVLNPAKQNFSWWDYRGRQWEQNKGMRLDYILLSPLAADLLVHADIETEWRGRPEPSDHAPVVCQLCMQRSAVLFSKDGI